MGDFNARVGSSPRPFDVIGQYGEPVSNRNGARLIDLLHASDLYSLHGRQLSFDSQPLWTRCRVSRGEQSIIDYLLVDCDMLSSSPRLQVFHLTFQITT